MEVVLVMRPHTLLTTRALLALVVTVAGSGLVGVATAVPAAAATVPIEAETMVNTTGSAFPRASAGASGGAERVFWSNGTARQEVTAAGPFTGVTVRARGDRCGGSPVVEVRVDGTLVTRASVSGSTWTTYSAAGSWAAGKRAVTVAFVNDHRTGWCDRNLYVDVVSFTGLTTVTPPVDPVIAPPRPNPFLGSKGYVEPYTQARTAADARRSWDAGGAAALDRIAAAPQPVWFGDWNSADALAADVDRHVDAAVAQAALPVMVAYAIPFRDCGGYSAGGLSGPGAYSAWIDQLARGIGDRAVVVVLEPDSLNALDCLDATRRAERFAMLSAAVTRLSTNPRTAVYLDAGHSSWRPAEEVASSLRQAGVAGARGFAVNVSNFVDTPTSVAYGDRVSVALGGTSTFVVDTSRNGLGSNGEWCNPAGRALGPAWTTSTGSAKADALLWLKRPGESDGTCNGGPVAGQFWVEYAIGLAQRAP